MSQPERDRWVTAYTAQIGLSPGVVDSERRAHSTVLPVLRCGEDHSRVASEGVSLLGSYPSSACFRPHFVPHSRRGWLRGTSSQYLSPVPGPDSMEGTWETLFVQLLFGP